MVTASLLKPKLYSKIKPKDFSDGLIQEVINPNKDGKYKFINPDNPNDYIIYP
jgi:hypothetical protein